MAYIANFLTQSSTSGAASYVLTLPPHVTDDIILVGASCDGGGTLSFTWGGNSTGATQVGTTQTSSTLISTAVSFAKATGTAATCTVNMGTADGIQVHMVILKDVDTTTQLDASGINKSGRTVSTTIATTATSGTGTIATITFGAQTELPFPVGTLITVAGVTPAGYNATNVAVTACTTTTVSYANTTTGAQTVAGTVNSTDFWFNSASITTTTADCLLVYYHGVDNATTTPSSVLSHPGPVQFLDSSDNGGTTVTTLAAGALGWYVQRTAGATPTPKWETSNIEITHQFVMAFRNKSGGLIPPYVDDSATLGTKLTFGSWFVAATTRNNENFKATPLTYATAGPQFATTSASGTGATATIGFATQPAAPFAVNSSITVAGVTPTGYNQTAATVTAVTTSSVSYANVTTGAQTVAGTVGGLGTVFDAAASVVDAGLNPYSAALNSTPATTTITASGFELGFPTTVINMTTGWVTGIFRGSTSKMALFNQGSIAQGGIFLMIGAGTTNYRSYNIMGRNNQDGNGEGFTIFSVQANQTQTQFGYSVTAPTITAIDKILILHEGQNATGAFWYSDIHLMQKVIAAGGDATTPVDTQGLFDIGKYCRLPLIKKIGAAEITAYVPVQIGGGDAVNLQIDAGALQFPRISSSTKKEINYHGADNAIGISYAGKSGDVIKHTNSVVTSPSPYYWEINSAATSAATWDFKGLLIVGANVTLRNVMTFDSMGFSGCPTLNFTGCTVNNSSIKGVPATNDSITVSSTTALNTCSITTTTVTAGNRWISVAIGDVDIFTSCTFTGSSTSGHAIRISSTGTVTLSGNTFTSYGPAARSFLTSSAGINDATDVITLDTTHGYTNGDPAYYQKQGGTQAIGMNNGDLNYVRSESSTTITLYDTSAHAITGGATGRVNLTAAGAETHYIYSAGAAIFNNSGGAVTINITNGGSSPSIRNSEGSSTTVNITVNLTVTVVNRAGTAISAAQVWIQKQATDTDSGHPGNPFTLASGNNQGDPDIVVNQTPPADLPGSGWLTVKGGGGEQTYRYSSKSGTTFTFATEVTGTGDGTGTSTTLNETGIGSKNIVEGDTIRNTTANPDQWAIVLSVSANSVTTTTLTGGGSWASAAYSVHRLAVNYNATIDTASVPLLNEETDGSGVATEVYNYLANKAILVKIRKASSEPQYLPFSTTGTITSSGFSLSATLDEDTILQ